MCRQNRWQWLCVCVCPVYSALIHIARAVWLQLCVLHISNTGFEQTNCCCWKKMCGFRFICHFLRCTALKCVPAAATTECQCCCFALLSTVAEIFLFIITEISIVQGRNKLGWCVDTRGSTHSRKWTYSHVHLMCSHKPR